MTSLMMSVRLFYEGQATSPNISAINAINELVVCFALILLIIRLKFLILFPILIFLIFYPLENN